MSSTKRKQNKPQKIFNSKLNNKSSETIRNNITNKNNSSDKIEIKEAESAPKLRKKEEQQQVWRVISDISSPLNSTMKETKRNDTPNLIQPESSNIFLDNFNSNNNNKFNETLLSLMQPSVGMMNNMNLAQTIEKLVLMNLTPYLLGMMNNSQMQTPALADSYPLYDNYLSAFSSFKKQDANQYDLFKESIENILPKYNTTSTLVNPLQYLSEQIQSNVEKKKELDELNCSCGAGFDSLELLNLHLKQTNHKARQAEKPKQTRDELDKLNKSKKALDLPSKNQENTKSSTPSSTASSVCLSPSRSPMSSATSVASKMVRGQEEWVKNSRDNNFIAQILKCLECSASFETLADLSLHMLHTNHFSKIHQQSLSAPAVASPYILPQQQHHMQQANTHVKHVELHAKNSSSGSSQSKQLVKNKKPETSVSMFSSSSSTNNNNASCRLKNSIINQSELKCLICNKKFDNLSNNDQQVGLKSQQQQQQHQLPPLVKLIQHLQNVHKITNVCTNCGAFFKNTEDLQRHLVEETYIHHNYSNQLTNSSNKIKLKRTNSNSNLNAKKFKSDNSIGRNESDNHADYSNESLKLNLSMNITNSNLKQRNETNDKCLKNKLNTNSISPSSSTSSYSYSSSNSSPSSLPSFDHNQQQTKVDSHPLLALQMFVNGSNTLAESSLSSVTSSSLSSSRNLSLTNLDQMNKAETSKLPAKKRPYIDDSNRNEFENSRSSFKQLATNNNISTSNDKSLDDMSGSFLISKLNFKSEENCFKRSKPSSDDLDTLTKENKKCHSPLNLLQKMQIGLDDYLMR